MGTKLFDIETDGLYFEATKIHSLVIKDVDTGEVTSCSDREGFTPVIDGLRILMDADCIAGHNIVGYDLPVIQKLYPKFTFDIDNVQDTLLLSRIGYPDLETRDIGVIKKGRMLPRYRGSHALKAWGYRLGVLKGDFAEESDWQQWTPEMQAYCGQDVEVTEALWHKLQALNIPERANVLEHWFAFVISLQVKFGFKFNVKDAAELYSELAEVRQKLDVEVIRMFKPWYVNAGIQVPKRSNKTLGYIEGAPLSKVKLQEFNPASRQQIAERLIKTYGWKPQETTPSGQPRIDELVLSKLKYPSAAKLAERFLIEKRIGMIAEGANAWLKLERKGRIHGSVNTIGAVTGRCTHSSPNVAQVPSIRALYGERCRALFHVDEGFIQIGADASGLELRCLAHYMARYDGGSYVKLLLEGDVHTANQQAAGLPTRDTAKTFIYAFLYGAGDFKIGTIVGKGAKAGKELKENFLNRTPALKRLREDVATAAAKGFIIGIDGRKLHIRSEHAALNTLLQSAGALLVKQATVNLYQELSTRGYIFGKDWAMVAHVHDEFQLQVRKGLKEEVMQVSVEAFRKAGEDFEWRCPLDGEAKSGANWAECH